jgi:uncharacterized membrane protein
MSKGRLEAFSDGVIAILITIMVLELKSFVFLGIYWNNHHHLFQAVDGRILWANLHLLFWLSLVPFVTAWMGEHPAEPVPVAVYGIVLFLAGCAYYVLARGLVALHDRESTLARALGEDRKGLLSIVIYGGGIDRDGRVSFKAL